MDREVRPRQDSHLLELTAVLRRTPEGPHGPFHGPLSPRTLPLAPMELIEHLHLVLCVLAPVPGTELCHWFIRGPSRVREP